MTTFDWEEFLVLGILNARTKDDAVKKIQRIIPYVDDEEMITLIENINTKLLKIPESEYQKIDLDAYKNIFAEEDEVYE